MERRVGKAPSETPSFQPYWGKPAVRNDRGDRGDVGIIRSPVRASILPDCGGRSVMGVPTAIGSLSSFDLAIHSDQHWPPCPERPFHLYLGAIALLISFCA